ncbi:MAG: PRC-barrel domain-containing protein, partial [Kiloniellales bacterium]|nr:PRC-barrel domain-containing protein [Kiloniellales bacterium]
MLLTLDQVRGCDILAKDGSIGKSHDFFFDDHSWTVRYLVVDTGWLFGRRVLVSPEAITAVDVSEKEIAVDLTKE